MADITPLRTAAETGLTKLFEATKMKYPTGVSIAREEAFRYFEAVGLPTRMDEIPGTLPPVETLMNAIAQDKKVSGGKLTFILTRGIGQSFVADDVPGSEVTAFLKEKHPG